MRTFIFICSLVLWAMPLFTSANPVSAEDSLWHAYGKTNDPSQKANILLNIAEEFDLRNDLRARDSIFDIAIGDIQIKTQDSILVNLYTWYFDKEDEFFTKRSIDYSRSLSEIARKGNKNSLHAHSMIAKAKLNLYQYKFAEALENANQGYYYSTLTSDPTLKVKLMLLLGNCLEKNNKKIEAFKKYTDALYLSRQIENEQLVYQSYQSLASFYYLIDNCEKAKEYANEQLKILVAHKPIDSLTLMKLNLHFTYYLFDNNESKAGINITQQVINYALAHNYNKIKQKIFVSYRTFLINNSLFRELSDLYTKQYPDELTEIANTNPNLYFRLKAFITEANGEMDSSEYYYNKVVTTLEHESNNVFISNFYKRYGEFLIRNNRINEAEEKLKLAFDYAEQAQYVPYLTELSRELDSLSYSQGKLADAYKYAKLNLQYNKQSELAQQEEKLLKIEVENEARERELMAKREEEATERRHNIQYMGISILIVLSFIVLAMLGSLKVPRIAVKALGFFSFIFLFEFIIMLADHKIHHITHGEPWKFLLFKIFLIAILLPLHHWVEEKVVHYLVHHKMIDNSKVTFKNYVMGLFKKKPAVEGIKIPAKKRAVKKKAGN